MSPKPVSQDAPSETPSLQRPELFPFRLLGMGLWIVWQWCTHWDTTLHLPAPMIAGGTGDYALYDLTMRIVDIATMVALAVAWRRLTPLFFHGKLQAFAACSVILGTGGIIGTLNLFDAPVVIAVLSSGLAAFGGAVLFLSWAEIYSRLEPNRMMLNGLLSLILAGIVSFLLNNLASPLPLMGSVAVPAISFLMCRASARYIGMPANNDDAPRVRFGFPWKPVALMAFAGFTAGFGSFTLFGQTASTRMLATFVVGVALLAALAVFRGKIRPNHLANTAFALTVVGLVLIATTGSKDPEPAAFLIMVAYIMLCVFGLALLGNLSFRFGIPSLWLFGLGRAASELMMGLGSYGRFFPGATYIAENNYALALVSLVELVCLGLAIALWRSEHSFSSNWAIETIDLESGRAVVSEQEAFLAACRDVACAAGLTEREVEVFRMLVLQQSYQEICQALFLSLGTVKTHVRHIYGKLDVHSREEALDLVTDRLSASVGKQ